MTLELSSGSWIDVEVARTVSDASDEEVIAKSFLIGMEAVGGEDVDWRSFEGLAVGGGTRAAV